MLFIIFFQLLFCDVHFLLAARGISYTTFRVFYIMRKYAFMIYSTTAQTTIKMQARVFKFIKIITSLI